MGDMAAVGTPMDLEDICQRCAAGYDPKVHFKNVLKQGGFMEAEAFIEHPWPQLKNYYVKKEESSFVFLFPENIDPQTTGTYLIRVPHQDLGRFVKALDLYRSPWTQGDDNRFVLASRGVVWGVALDMAMAIAFSVLRAFKPEVEEAYFSNTKYVTAAILGAIALPVLGGIIDSPIRRRKHEKERSQGREMLRPYLASAAHDEHIYHPPIIRTALAMR